MMTGNADQLLEFLLLSEAGYLILDSFVNLERENLDRTARRIVVVSVLSLIGSSIFGTVIGQVSQDVPALAGPVLSAVWIVLLAFVFGGSWELYHSMLAYSGRIESERVDTVELVEKRTGETLAPVQEKIDRVEAIASALRTSVEQWASKTPDTLDAMRKASESTRRTVQSVCEWIELAKNDMDRTTSRYEELAEAHRNDAATIYLVSNKLESLVERASILEEEIDELLDERAASHDEEDRSITNSAAGGSTTAETPASPGAVVVAAAANKESAATEHHRRLTRDDGLANRERGNNAQLRFCEEILRGAGKMVDNSIKEATPDYVFYAPGTRNARGVGAFKALTLTEDGTRQRWIPRRKVLAEQRLALKLGVPLILFVMNFTNGRIWAKVMSVEELKGFSGLTTPLMIVKNDSEAEKACKETLEMALQLL